MSTLKRVIACCTRFVDFGNEHVTCESALSSRSHRRSSPNTSRPSTTRHCSQKNPNASSGFLYFGVSLDKRSSAAHKPPRALVVVTIAAGIINGKRRLKLSTTMSVKTRTQWPTIELTRELIQPCQTKEPSPVPSLNQPLLMPLLAITVVTM